MQRRTMCSAIAAMAASTLVPVAARAQAFSVFEQVYRLREQLARDLFDPVVRFGLVEFASVFRDARVKAAPRGYEKDEKYQSISLEILQDLKEVLSKFPKMGNFADNFVLDARTAYEINQKSISGVYAAVRKEANLLFMLTDDDITDLQLRIAVILDGIAETLWNKARSITFCYPFC